MAPPGLEDSWIDMGISSVEPEQHFEKSNNLNDWVDVDEKQDNLPEPLSFTREAQFQRDIDMITGAIERPGENPFSAAILKKIFTLFHYGDLRYFKDGEWHPWDLPLASAISHGARVTIQFPNDLSKDIMAWLFEGENKLDKYVRNAATHGLKAREKSEIQFNPHHSLREIKLSMQKAASQASVKFLADLVEWIPLFGKSASDAIKPRKVHFGINLALGGAGNTHFTSRNVIEPHGQHGHLYVFYRPAMKDSTYGGLLVGIEQSAPGCPDQNGGSHGVMATHHALSATAGEDFGKNNSLVGHGPNRYYDGIFLDLTEEQFHQIKNQEFNLAMLSTVGNKAVARKAPYADVQPEALVTLVYNEKKLTRYKEKQAGKNNGVLDGFYKDEEGNEYFIKVPSDQTELFTELFTGKILDQFKKFLPAQYRESLICADQVELPDGTYGLIQPRKNIKEVWKYFVEQAANQPKSYVQFALKGISDFISNPYDRNIPYEIMYGQTQQYPLLAELGDINSLAICLLYSLMMGDYSVHSANIVYSAEEKKEVLFSKIDFGAALRYIGDRRNIDIMNPVEYHGLFWFKYYTKGFHLLYKNVPGLYKAVSVYAKELFEKCSEEELYNIVLAATKAIPTNLLEQSEQYATAAYMGIDEFKAACLGKDRADEQFSRKLASILFTRVQKLAALSEIEIQPSPPDAAEAPRLGPNRMFDFAFQKLKKAWVEKPQVPIEEEEEEKEDEQKEELVDLEEKQPIEIIIPDAAADIYAARFVLNENLNDGSNIVLTSPASDIETIDASAVGTTPLPQMLKQIRELQKDGKNNTYFVPLAECWPTVPYGPPRQHWTLLMIRGDRCYFVDPCPLWKSASLPYSKGPFEWGMVRMLQASRFDTPSTSYLGWQQDSVNCGRYVSAIIGEVAKLIYSGIAFAKIPSNLEQLSPHPTAETLVQEETHCTIPEEIASNKIVCDLRRQEEVFEYFVAAKKAEEEEKARAKAEAEEKAKVEAAEKARLKAEEEEKARLKAEEEARAQAEAEEKARLKAEEEARAQPEAEEKARLKVEEEARAQAEAEEKARDKAEEEKARAAAVAKKIKKITTKAGTGFAIGILLTGIGLLAKFSLLVAISVTSTAGIPVIIIGGVLTFGSTVYYCAMSNRKQSASVHQDDNHQESMSSVCCGCLYRVIGVSQRPSPKELDERTHGASRPQSASSSPQVPADGERLHATNRGIL
jgi:hypothetical protein